MDFELLLDRCFLFDLQSGDGEDLRCLELERSLDFDGLGLAFWGGWPISLRTALKLVVCFGFEIADFSVGLLFFGLLAVIGCFEMRDEADWLFALRVSPPLWFARFSFFFLVLDGSGSRSDNDPVSGERSSRISLTSESSSSSSVSEDEDS